MILGITGGSGTGKSSACAYFRDRNFVIIDADMVAREVCNAGTECLGELVQYFGNEIVDASGNLMRKKLGSIVFADADKLRVLNKITHKHIIKRIKELADVSKNSDLVIDAPLLLETGLDDICDATLFVSSTKEKRILRIVARDCLSEEEAKNRIGSQKDDNYYKERCDYTVTNNGTEAELMDKLDKIFGGEYGSQKK